MSVNPQIQLTCSGQSISNTYTTITKLNASTGAQNINYCAAAGQPYFDGNCNTDRPLIPQSTQLWGLGIEIGTQFAGLGCNDFITSQIQLSQEFRNAFEQQTGCPVYTNTINGNNIYSVNCQFQNTRPVFQTSSNCQVNVVQIPPVVFPEGFLPGYTYVTDTCMQYQCTQTEWDINYYSLCCNAPSSVDINTTTLDPLTGLPFNYKSCAQEWCLSDPRGQCLPIFEGCQGTSPCGRHWLLSNIAKPTTDPELSSLSIKAHDHGNGLGCWQWYEVTSEQASFRAKIDEQPNQTLVATNRVNLASNLTKNFCLSAENKGQGECACINGYNQMNANFGVPNINLQAGPTTKPPYMVSLNDKGTARRVDAYCILAGVDTTTEQYSFTLASWTNLLTRTINGITYTYSNVCSQSRIYNPEAFPQATMNPIGSFASFSNFGDMNYFDTTNLLQLGDTPPFTPMPIQCWLPACVATSDNVVFRDLLQYTITCPNICYKFSGGDSINITTTDDTFVNINSNNIGCGDEYTYTGQPFTVPEGCKINDIRVPPDFSRTINIQVTYPNYENALGFMKTTMTAYSNAYPLLSVFNTDAQAFSFSSTPAELYALKSKPQYNTIPQPQSLTLQVQINTQGERYQVYNTAITLFNEQAHTLTIPFRIAILGDIGDGTIGSVSCNTCDAAFSSCQPTPFQGCNSACPPILSFPPPPTGAIVIASTTDGGYTLLPQNVNQVQRLLTQYERLFFGIN